ARSPQLEAIKETVRAIIEAENLPGPLDYEVLIPPGRTAWCRRVFLKPASSRIATPRVVLP
ncbi:MAG TPA: hypothetical protein VK459_08140, partial [Polyangiaceae bacterium]|nr:hypothetical protein [Polyangiaceae bacterium]